MRSIGIKYLVLRVSGKKQSRKQGHSARGGQIEEPQLPVPALEAPICLEIEHAGDETIPRVEEQDMERTLRPGAFGGGVLRERELEEAVQLHALAAEPGIVDDEPPGGDVAGAGERGGGGAAGSRRLKHPEIPLAEVEPAKRDALLRIPQPVKDHQ